MAFPCADNVHHRIEIVYHESLDTTFQTSLDFGIHLEQFCSWYFEDVKKMGKVIKIEIPLFSTPNGNHEARSQFAVYVKNQAQDNGEEAFDEDFSLERDDLGDLDRAAYSTEHPTPSDNNDLPMEDATAVSTATRTRTRRAVTKTAVATAAKTITKASNNIYTKEGNQPVNNANLR
ncbi:hypothetical protein KI688_007934 [Linnemannia hyalina]|uniref:Uncharacterized protein n=1 Tax=Linnemannia hyalina TaxID=64524 RepID=A0A9P8BM69_9FUNG|nr:hypothetical protein KI688_007934 [Linnemannia hyalina]